MLNGSLNRVADWEWRLEPHAGMHAPVVLFGPEGLPQQLDQAVFDQLIRVASLPGVVDAVYAMPDVQPGDGYPIGVVTAFSESRGGIVCGGAVGFDVSCGLRVLRCSAALDAVRAQQRKLAEALFAAVPECGVSGRLHLPSDQLDEVLAYGARWAVERGFGQPEDLDRIEDGGRCTYADPGKVSSLARQRQQDDLGTLGSGTHFIELQYVNRIRDAALAREFGLCEDQVLVSIHAGAREAGHQISRDFHQAMVAGHPTVPGDVPMAMAPIQSELGQAYLGAMGAAVNAAYANRQILTQIVRETLVQILDADVELVCDVSHNSCRMQDEPDGPTLVHRRGAIATDRSTAVPIPIPVVGSMGQPSFLAVPAAHRRAFGSTCHGAGRTIRRSRSRKLFVGRDVAHDLAQAGVLVRSSSLSMLATEAPAAYRDVREVLDAAVGAGLLHCVAELRPLVIIRR